MSSAGRHILGLDLVRFGAAAMVAVFHLGFWSWVPDESLTRSVAGDLVTFPQLVHVTWFGWVGVEIFFVLSGFVIAYSADGASPLSFLRSRVVRLYPAAWICATATLLVTLLLGRADQETAGAYVGAMTLWIAGPWIDGVYWTIGIEIVFYATIFAVLSLRHLGAAPSVTMGGALCAMGVWSTSFWVASAIARMHSGLIPDALHALLASRASFFLLLRHGCFFALGGLLWLCLCRRATFGRVAVAMLCLGGGVIEILDSARVTFVYLDAGAATRALPALVWLLAVAAMAASVLGNRVLHAICGKAAGTIRLLGLMTYPLYLLHDVVGAALLRVAARFGLPNLLVLGLAVAGVVALAWVVTVYLEAPLQAQLRRAMAFGGRPAMRPG